jgi:cytoskeleton protein RodZ
MHTNEEPSALPPEEPQNRVRGVGETLKAAREAARVSLEQAGEELRIEPKFLAALEQERYEAIGIPVFAKGYLKLYCEYLALDYRRLLPLYEEKAGKQAPPLRGRHSIERRERSSSGLWVAVGLAVVVLVLLLIWLLRDSGPSGSGVTVGSNAPSTAAGAERAASPIAAEVGRAAPSAEVSGVDAGAADNAAVGPATQQAPAVATASGSQPVAATKLDVAVKFVQDSWVEVKDSSNARLYYGLGKAGEESHLVGSPPLAVLIGNADGVVLEVGGRPYAYPRRARGKIASFTLTAPSE